MGFSAEEVVAMVVEGQIDPYDIDENSWVQLMPDPDERLRCIGLLRVREKEIAAEYLQLIDGD